MKVQVLMSTCKAKKIKDLKLEKRNIKKNCLIINQMVEKDSHEKQGTFEMYSYNERGLSKSRNHLIEKASGDVGIITDDDITFLPFYDKMLAQAYADYPDADVITFCTKKGDHILGANKSFRHNLYTMMTIASFQISFRIPVIQEKQLRIDERFGIGAKYKAGEENIFLHDCVKAGLHVRHVPIIINEHPDEPTTGEKWDADLAKQKGAFSYRILKHMHGVFFLYFVLLKHKNYKQNLTIREFTHSYFEGVREYKKEN